MLRLQYLPSLPLWKCGLKYTKADSLLCPEVTSLVEVWIEIQIVVKVFLIPSVTSLAEVWIEMFKSLAPLGISQVTSLAEVWIEILSRSTYGNPRSKCYHHKYYKDLLKSLDLPDIHFHQLRNTYATILLKNSFNSKGVSHLLGHAKEIISVDVYGDTQEIIEDCLDVLEPFIEEVIPKERKDQYYDYSEMIEIDLILEEYFNAA